MPRRGSIPLLVELLAMPELVELVILGVVQGVSEFLPISSDGHLVIVNALLEHLSGRHRGDVLERTVALHAGTLLAVLVVYGHEFWRALRYDRRILGLLIVGTLPAVLFGVLADKFFKAWLEDPRLAALGLIATGGLLIWGASRQRDGQPYRQLRYPQAAWIGLFQAAAILPGVSRSGSTIAAGLRTGLGRADAATFSFLLSIPAVAGACAWEGLKATTSTSTVATPAPDLLIGAAVSFIVGWVSLLALLRILQAGRLHLFAYYCIALGLAVAAWQLA
jgi:undecaprenyl-diphosphatase